MEDNCFKLMDGELCELGHGPHTWSVMLDYRQNGSRDIVISVGSGTLNDGNYIYFEHGSTKGVSNSVPVYDYRERIKLECVEGKIIASVPRSDGLYDLLSYGRREGHPGEALKLYKNSGEPGLPRFDGAYEYITVNGGDIRDSLENASISSISVFNDAGKRYNLVISCSCGGDCYWPAGLCPRDEGEHPVCGFNRGYDDNGVWLGKEKTIKIFVAENKGADGFDYGEPVEVYSAGSLSSIPGCAVIAEGDRKYLCFNAEVDRVFQAEYSDGRLVGPVCEAACSPLKQGYMTSFACADIDNDGNDEIIFGSNPGMTFWMDLNGGVFTEMPAFKAYNGYVWGESLSVPCLADFDGDGDGDLVLGDASGYLWFYENVSQKKDEFLFKAGVRLRTANGGVIHRQAGYSGSIQGPNEARWGYLKVLAVDWDNDGRTDIITNDVSGDYLWYRNIGDKNTLVLDEPVSLICGGKPFRSSTRSRPGIWSDGRLVVVNVDGYLQFYERDRNDPRVVAEGKTLRYKDGGGIKVSGSCGYSGRAVIAACDWDGDGRTDLLGGTLDHNMRYINSFFPNSASPFLIRNIGTDSDPVFERPVLITRADGTVIDFAAHECSVWTVDIDADGQPDLINGAEDGRVYYWNRDDLKWDWDCTENFTHVK